MIVRTEGDDLVLVTQPDHAHFAAEVLRLFRSPGLAGHPRRQAILRAVRLHDNGWREVDAAPRADADGRPIPFPEIGPELRVEIWRRGVLRYEEEDPYVALLTLCHARAVHPAPEGELAALLAELEERAEPWYEAAATTPEEVDMDYPWLALGDLLSLAAAHRWEEERTVHGHSVRWAEGGLVIEPFPLAGTTRFPLAARRIPNRRYASDRELAVTLATANWLRLEVRIRPAA